MASEKLFDIRHQLTSGCNARCPECTNEGTPIGSNRNGSESEIPNLGDNDVLRIARAVTSGPNKDRLETYAITGGEPLLRTDLVLKLVLELHNAGVKKFWVNTNGFLLKPKLIGELKAAGLPAVKIHFPSCEPGRYTTAMGLKNESLGGVVLNNVTQSVHNCLSAGLKVDLNAPLMRGINDTKEQVVAFEHLVSSGAILKFLALDQGVYGVNDQEFYETHRVEPQNFINTIGARWVEPYDSGRGGIYALDIQDAKPIKFTVVNYCSPELIPGHPTGDSSVVIEANGRMRPTMWNRNLVALDSSGDIETQINQTISGFLDGSGR